MPAGRPSKFTEKLALTICWRMSEGESLRQICRDPQMPSASTVHKWVLQKPEFAEQYARAREMLMEHWADEIIEIADDGSNDWMEKQNADGETIAEVVNHEHIQRSRVRIDTRKWLMSKLAPKRYGDKVTQEITGKDGGPIETAELSQVERARRWVYLGRRIREAASNGEERKDH